MIVIYSVSQPFNSVEFGRVIPDPYQGERSSDSALRTKSGAAKCKKDQCIFLRVVQPLSLSPDVDLLCKFLNI